MKRGECGNGEMGRCVKGSEQTEVGGKLVARKIARVD